MNKFLTLTETTSQGTLPEKTYINVSHIKWFRNYLHDGKRTCTHVVIESLGKAFIAVEETAEEILDMINSNN